MSSVSVPPGKQTFLDPDDGKLLSLGTVTHYIPSTTTFKNTWADEAQSQVNTNPIVLDASASCSIWGEGLYRQIVRDSAGNTIWDRVTGYDELGGGFGVVDSVLAAIATRFSSDQIFVSVAGYAIPGDGGAAIYQRALANPGHPGAFQSAGGTWWVIAEPCVRPQQFGVITGSASTTRATLVAFFDFIISQQVPGLFEDLNLTVNGPIATVSSVNSGALNLIIKGSNVISVDAASTPFEFLLFCNSVAITSHSIAGPGRLTINGNDLIMRAIHLSHAGALGGSCILENVWINGVRGHSPSSAVYVAYAINVTGGFEYTSFTNCHVNGVTRANVNGDCKGIRVSQSVSPVFFTDCSATNVLNATQDADGMAVFSDLVGTGAQGRAVFTDCSFSECQGRSIKTQVSHTEVVRPYFKRQAVVSIANGHDIDAQYGDLYCVDPTFEYRKSAGVSPLGASFRAVSVQHLYNDGPKRSLVRDGKILSEVALPGFLAAFFGATTPNNEVLVDGLVGVPLAALTTTMISRAIIEFAASGIEATSGVKTSIRLRNTVLPNTLYGIGYTGYGSTNISTKLEVEVTGNENVLSTPQRIFGALSGATITNISRYRFRENIGYRSFMETGWNVDLTDGAILAGNDFGFEISAAVVTNPPATLPGAGIARVRTGSDIDAGLVTREIFVNNAAVPNTYFYLLTGGVWGVIV